ncbi:hypothetical protein H012_gp751 [Acanthamoeba polyphaga moumouvirus]|uniref:Uncharacterized protein n=1 Tax=Acanthamoeba polyphaga moumouvirus TaxID=1269028 RepID=L7RB91_9VIRU|nr:hypothetical protein H012_gp751 [Acanthamoeba polyphaga moumouvirus]AGC01714.1 hypothetical protein Moumou_00170 [Acanthamoeba polyphaga moumouvirus]
MACNNVCGYACYPYFCATYNPCQVACIPYPPVCQTTCVPSCPPVCPPTPPIPPPPIVVEYATTTPSGTPIPTSPVGVPPTPIPVGSTVIPAGTVTVISGYSPTPTRNVGGITLNTTTNQFTIPLAGRYLITSFIGITANPTGVRESYIYRVSGTTGVISLIASDSRNATDVGATFINLTTEDYFQAGDRIFFAVAQNSGAVLSTTSNSRFTITRLSS